MNSAFKIGLVSILALTTAAPAFAQYRPTQQYERDLRDYQDDRQDYAAARAEYERRLADYEAARDAYDRRYGIGAYSRYYGPAPIWDSARWDRRDDDRDGYDRDRDGYDRDRNSYGRDDRRYGDRGGAYDPCRQRTNSNTAAGGIIGALAGAAIGSNVAARNARTEGAVLGAVVGGVAGASIGRQSTKCDADGYYFTYQETVPYRESRYERGRRSGQYDYSYYSRQRCRLAAAPIDWDDRGREVRYVRVCPDRQGRYRVTG